MGMKHLCAVALLYFATTAGAQQARVFPAGEGLTSINAIREKDGLEPVKWHSALESAARAYARDMLANKRQDPRHIASDGSTIVDRVKRGSEKYGGNFCVNYDSPLENSWGGPTYGTENWAPSKAIEWWMTSPGHKSNILGSKVTHMAMAGAGDGENTYYVLVLGQEC